MKTLYSLALAGTFLTAGFLSSGGASAQDEGLAPVTTITAPTAPPGLVFAAPSDAIFQHHFYVAPREIDPARQDKALRKFESNIGDSWDDRIGSAGEYSYTNLESNADGTTFNIATAVVKGLHMDRKSMRYDSLTLTDLTLTDEDEGVSVKAGTMVLAHPSKGLEDFDFANWEFDEHYFGFKALQIDDLSVQTTEDDVDVDINIGKALMTFNPETKLLDAKLEDVILSVSDFESGELFMSFDALYMTGLDLTILDDIDPGLSPDEMEEALNDAMLRLGKFYDRYGFNNFKMDSDFFSLDADGMAGIAVQTENIVTENFQTRPFVLQIKEGVYDLELGRDTKEVKAIDEKDGSEEPKMTFAELQAKGLDRFQFTARGLSKMDMFNDIISVEEYELEVQDWAKIDLSYKLLGLQAFMEKTKNTKNEKKIQKAFEEYVSIDSFSIAIEDQTLVKRSLELAAEAQSTTPDATKAQLMGLFALMPLMAETDFLKELANMSFQSVKDFMEGGKTITIAVNPETPLNLDDILEVIDYDGKAADLGISIKTE